MERRATSLSLPGVGPVEDQAEATTQSRHTATSSVGSKQKRDTVPVNMEKEYPLTNAMLKMIRDALPVPNSGFLKRDNSSAEGIPSASSVFNTLSPDTQSTLKDTVRYGIALIMKEAAWALSP